MSAKSPMESSSFVVAPKEWTNNIWLHAMDKHLECDKPKSKIEGYVLRRNPTHHIGDLGLGFRDWVGSVEY